MHKNTFLVVILLSFFLKNAHSTEENIFYENATRMVGDYSSVVLIALNSSLNNTDNKKYHIFKNSKKPTINTLDSINRKFLILSNNRDVNAVTSVHLLKDGKNKECVIVYKKGISLNTLKHETGHCFTPIRYKVSGFVKQNSSDDYDDYLNELSADLVASIISLKLENEPTYIRLRTENIENKGASAVNYKLVAKAFPGLKVILSDYRFTGKSHEEAVKEILGLMSQRYPPLTEHEYWEDVKAYNKLLKRN
ncbi:MULTISPECIES: hypothetical protein [Vibrio]|uniref:hypothetical protein n=1 Tax=Vibrio TaxID=662 RepID=UPI0020C0C984|nr:hypothetical protein [Vibrio sp. 1CM23M]MCK8069848.1 hypothetical protein [Vibrio sp. 1CM23M]